VAFPTAGIESLSCALFQGGVGVAEAVESTFCVSIARPLPLRYTHDSIVTRVQM
jgi:hypothetical protein